MLVGEDGPTMFYGTHFIMSPPAKSKLKRQGQLLSSVLSRTLSYKYRDLDTPYSGLGASDDPAELSTQLSAPGVLKVFGDVCPIFSSDATPDLPAPPPQLPRLLSCL